MGPQDPNDVSRDIARDLTGIAGELAALKGDAARWLTSSEYAALKHRLEDAHADYINGWNQQSLLSKIGLCLKQTQQGEVRPDACRTGLAP